LQEFRVHFYQSNHHRVNIEIRRDRLLEDVLGLYNNPEFNVLGRPRVRFVGEPGNKYIHTIYFYLYILYL
jgi:hypothetical protein